MPTDRLTPVPARLPRRVGFSALVLFAMAFATQAATAPAGLATPAAAEGFVRISDRVWAFIARDERSANGALFIGTEAALAVDPGLTPEIARRFFSGARAITDRPIRTVVLSHWHPDHALGAACLDDPSFALLASTATRRALAENLAAVSRQLATQATDPKERRALDACAFRLPQPIAMERQRQEIELGGHRVVVTAVEPAHTAGDLVVWSAAERVLATGDLFLNRSSPDMQEGRVAGLLAALDRLLELPIAQVIPGHFEPVGKAELARFRDYVRAVDHGARVAVQQGLAEGATPAVDLDAFKDFRQFPQYQATFADNLRAAAEQVRQQPARPGDGNGFAVIRRLRLGRNPHQIAFSPDGRIAYVAIAGDDRVARVDVATLTAAGGLTVADTPLGVHALASDDLLVSRFGGASIERRRWGEAEPLARLSTGAGPSLFAGPLPDGSLLAAVERNDTLVQFQPADLAEIARFPTGARPFPPAASADGRLAFVPNYDAGSVTVVDLWNRKVVSEVAVGKHPSGGVVLPGDNQYLVAVRGENRIAFIDSANKKVAATLAAGIGESPFSVVVAPNGRLAFVNNTASHDISVIVLPDQRVIARIAVGEIPIVIAVHPSGDTLWVSCEGSHELDIIAIPKQYRGGNDAHTPPPAGATRAEVAVLGMIHDAHRTSQRWSLDGVRETIERFRPDVVIAEIPPDRWPRIWADYAERGLIEDRRLRKFPEYVEVLLPLKLRLGFTVEPGAAWTEEMNELRNSRAASFASDPRAAERFVAYTAAVARITADSEHVTDSDDPRLIHSDRYDHATRAELAPYDQFQNDWIGPGGWTNINVAHYRLIDAAIRRHPGQRILITFGAAHKYWLLEQLRERADIDLLDITPFLPKP